MAYELPIRTSNRGQPDAGILRLPTELISAICGLFCFHCRGGRVVDATSKAVRAAYEDQMAISALSRCSRGLRDKAQPILFHWYHNLEEKDYGRQQIRLERFVEAIIRKPHLAASVKALAFYQPAEDEAPEHNWTTWSYPLPSLTTLVFPGTRPCIPRKEGTYHIREAAHLLRHAPNLHTLIAPDCGGGSARRHLFLDDDGHDAAWDVGPLPALRTLSLNGIGMPALARILRCCPALQDLEYLDEPASERVWVVLDPARHLGHLQGTLRRLCYSVFFPEFHQPEDWMDGNNNGVYFYCGAQYDDGPGMAPDGLGFAGFSVLEVLEIEQFLLYGPVFAPSESRFPGGGVCLRETTAENFLAKLPASLRRLRVGAVIHWPAMYRDLLALAEQQRARFLRLEAVAVEVYKAPPRYQAEHLAGVFAAAGVACSVTRARLPRAALRGLLPARPGRREIVPLPMVYPDSDYSESYYSESVSSDPEEPRERLL